MITREEVISIFKDKLERTGSLDDALWKACWVSYKDGYKDGSSPPEVLNTPPKWMKELLPDEPRS